MAREKNIMQESVISMAYIKYSCVCRVYNFAKKRVKKQTVDHYNLLVELYTKCLNTNCTKINDNLNTLIIECDITTS
jgi:hypothetical protein